MPEIVISDVAGVMTSNKKNQSIAFSLSFLACAILAISVLAAFSSPCDGWGGMGAGLYCLVGLCGTCLIGFVLGVIAKVTKENAPPIGLVLCSIVVNPGLLMLMNAFLA